MKKALSFNLQPKSRLILSITLVILTSLAACSPGVTGENSSTENSSSQNSQFMSSSSCNFSDRAQAGQMTVATADNLSLTRSNGETLPLKVYYPEAPGTYPTIIFSHGGGGSKDFYAALGRHWASHGYISIHPTHADSIELRGRDFIRELGEYAMTNGEAWAERAGDISLIIDSLDQITQQAPSLQGKFDPQQIGVGGHSFGAYTAQLVGGATVDLPNGPQNKSFADQRVKALLLLSPQGRGEQGLTASSWYSMTLPMMMMTGTNDTSPAHGKGPEWRRDPFDFAPPGDKYLVFIEGANHYSFSGRLAEDSGNSGPFGGNGRRGGGSIRDRIRQRIMRNRMQQNTDPNVDQTAIFRYVQTASVSFWDAYLKKDTEAKTCLQSQALENYADQDLSVSTR